MIYCYIRVSTDKQDYQRQENILKEKGYINGQTANRPFLQDLINNKIKKGDTLVSCELSRISRSVKDFNNLIDEILNKKKVNIVILKENFNLLANGNMDAMTKLILNITSAFAEFERDIIADRTKEALKSKMINGTKSGRPIGKPKSEYNNKENFIKTLDLIVNDNIGQNKATIRTKYPKQAFQFKIKECYTKYNTKDYKTILERLRGDSNTW